jgi:hypothetical protein
MCARSGAIHEYQSDQSSVTGLDGFLVGSSTTHAPPINENLDGSLHTRGRFQLHQLRASNGSKSFMAKGTVSTWHARRVAGPRCPNFGQDREVETVPLGA